MVVTHLTHFIREVLCICDVYQIYECNQLHRYILCEVVVIVCNEHWERGIQIEMTCNSKMFPCIPNQCQHHLNRIHIPCPELGCFTVTVFQNFRFECMVSILFIRANSEG